MIYKPTLILLALAIAAFPAVTLAREPNVVHIKTLAEISGMRDRQVSMLFAPARTSYAEYRYTFDRVEHKFIVAVGRDRYQQLQAGLPVPFERMVDGKRVVSLVQLDPSS